MREKKLIPQFVPEFGCSEFNIKDKEIARKISEYVKWIIQEQIKQEKNETKYGAIEIVQNLLDNKDKIQFMLDYINETYLLNSHEELLTINQLKAGIKVYFLDPLFDEKTLH